MGFMAGMVLAACGGGQEAPQEQQPAESEAVALGRKVYRSYCLSCHQADGNGVPGMYPPLVDSPWIQGDKGRLIRLLLNGMKGELVVKGERYNNAMAAHGHLSDEEIAGVLTFVRSNFDNTADPVTPAEVATIRASNTQKGPWTAQELEQTTGGL